MKRTAIGIRMHSGWGALVAVSNSAGKAEVKTSFYPSSFSRTALDQGSKNRGAYYVGNSGKQAKVISANRRSGEGSTGEKKLRPCSSLGKR
jgi:hypothetical protein